MTFLFLFLFVLCTQFQLTRSRGAWRDACMVCNANPNFNSHAHVERDIRYPWKIRKNWISTHTLTWSVTSGISQRTFCIAISTHTLTWSVTIIYWTNYKTWKISTHTLTWSVTITASLWMISRTFQLTRSRGAWQLRPYIGNSTTNFNSHAHVERDISGAPQGFKGLNFNSHAHVERDVSRWSWNFSKRHFNSHAHVERDVNIFDIFSFFHISTHTLTWSVTSADFVIYCIWIISTHTLTWSVTI